MLGLLVEEQVVLPSFSLPVRTVCRRLELKMLHGKTCTCVHMFVMIIELSVLTSEIVTISSLLVALIRIMCTALPSTSAKLVMDGKIIKWQFSSR